MKLHVLENIFFGNLTFHLHFWFCYTVFTVLLQVSWNQAITHHLTCGVDSLSSSLNFTRLQGTPVLVTQGDGCSYYFDNASQPFARSDLHVECVHYISNNSIIYI